MIKQFAWMMVGAGLLASQNALAVPMTVDFTVTATQASTGNSPLPSYNGYTAGALGGGSFTFDDAVGDYNDNSVGLVATDLSFNWLGTSWTEATARIGELAFESNGALRRWVFGGVVIPFCGLNCVSSGGPTDFWVAGFAPSTGQGSMAAIHIAPVNGFMFGSVTWSVRPTSIPEPASLVLLGLGLVGFAAARRTRNS